jgi:hypothetical protein
MSPPTPLNKITGVIANWITSKNELGTMDCMRRSVGAAAVRATLRFPPPLTPLRMPTP